MRLAKLKHVRPEYATAVKTLRFWLRLRLIVDINVEHRLLKVMTNCLVSRI